MNCFFEIRKCENCRNGQYTFVGGVRRCDSCGHEKEVGGMALVGHNIRNELEFKPRDFIFYGKEFYVSCYAVDRMIEMLNHRLLVDNHKAASILVDEIFPKPLAQHFKGDCPVCFNMLTLKKDVYYCDRCGYRITKEAGI